MQIATAPEHDSGAAAIFDRLVGFGDAGEGCQFANARHFADTEGGRGAIGYVGEEHLPSRVVSGIRPFRMVKTASRISRSSSGGGGSELSVSISSVMNPDFRWTFRYF